MQPYKIHAKYPDPNYQPRSRKTKPSILNLIGQVFGRLMVVDYLGQIGPGSSRKTLWLCSCDCGSENIKVFGNNLKTGNTSSCGCINKQIISKIKRKNITGIKLGRLTAIRYLYSDKHDKAVWLFNCDCGNTTETTASSFLKENTKSCGCLNGNGLADYDRLVNKLYADKVRRDPNNYVLLQVACTNCKQWFNPTMSQVFLRLQEMESGKGYFYCSQKCKDSCPIYKRVWYSEGHAPIQHRENFSEVSRQMALDLSEHACEKCGSKDFLNVHHILGYARNKMLGSDIDNLIVLCSQCHKEVHSQRGCTYNDLQREC